jgi:putative ABC transport system permease protein
MMDSSTFRIALRTLGRHKGFTTVAILSLAIAIALNTVMHSVTTAIVQPEIAVREPENLYTFRYTGNFKRQLTPDDIEAALISGNKDLVAVTGYTTYRSFQSAPVVESNDQYKRLNTVLAVRPNYFDFLGTPMIEGRAFRKSDETEGATPAVITRRLAEYLYPAGSAVGQRIMLDGVGYTVIGVFEHVPRFDLLASELFILRPAATPPIRVSLLRFSRKLPLYSMNEQFKLAAARLALAAGESPTETAFAGKPVFKAQTYNPLTGLRTALIAAVAAVLLVACANLANLQLARGLVRSRELALRAAVGATRRQLIQLLMLESGILALGGLLLGIALTLWGVYIVRATMPEVIGDYFIAPRVSWAIFVFAAVAAIVCLLLVGLVPAVRVSRVDPNEMLKAGAGTGANRQHRRRYGVMVIAQIGFALPVLIAAMLLAIGSYKLHSRHYLTRYKYGFDPKPIVLANVPILRDAARKSPSLLTIGEEVRNRALAVPGVVDAATVSVGFGRDAMVTSAELNGDQKERMANRMTFRIVSPSYFRVMGREIIKGRGFTETEIDGKSIVIDTRTAKYLFGDQDPIGRQVMFAARNTPGLWHTVVGVVGDKRSWKDIEQSDPYAGFEIAEVYRGIAASDTLTFGRRSGSILVYARAEGNAELAAIRILRNLRSLRGAEQPSAEPLERRWGLTYWRQANDFLAGLFGTFALVGIALVAIGVYSIVAHSVEERRREIAVRISMGATMRDILRAVLREGNVLILSGTAIGLFLSLRVRGWLMDIVDPYDATRSMLYAYVAAGLFALAVFAAFIPALRATRIDPVEALRSE